MSATAPDNARHCRRGDAGQEQIHFALVFAPHELPELEALPDLPEHLAEMDQAADRRAGNACFVAGVNRLAETRQGRQFRPGEISPLAGFPDTGGDSFFQPSAERNSTVRRW